MKNLDNQKSSPWALAVVLFICCAAISILMETSQALAEERAHSSEELGINADLDDVAGVYGDFCNAWVGYIDGRRVRVVAGYEYKNPLIGILWMTDGTKSGITEVFETPTSTGPACVASEHDGILTIRSEAGTFLRRDRGAATNSEEQVATSGNGLYQFDIRTEQFLKP